MSEAFPSSSQDEDPLLVSEACEGCTGEALHPELQDELRKAANPYKTLGPRFAGSPERERTLLRSVVPHVLNPEHRQKICRLIECGLADPKDTAIIAKVRLRCQECIVRKQADHA